MTVLDRISIRPKDDGGHQIVMRSEQPPVPRTRRKSIGYPNPYERYNEPRIREGSVPHNTSRLRRSGHIYGAHPADEPDTPLRLIGYPYPVDDEPAMRSGPTRRLQHSVGYYDSYDEPGVREPARPPQPSGNYYDLYDEPMMRSGPVRHPQQSGGYFNPYEDFAVPSYPYPYTYNPYLADREPEVLEGRSRRPQHSGNYYDPHDDPDVRTGSRSRQLHSGHHYDSLDQLEMRSGPPRPRQHSGHYNNPYADSAVRGGPISPQYTYNRRRAGHEPELQDGAVRRPRPQSMNLPAGPQPVFLPNGMTVWAPRPPAPNAGPILPHVDGYPSYDPALRGAPEQYRVRRGAWGGYDG